MNISRRLLTRYKFYDLVLQTPTHPQQPLESAMMTESELKTLKSTTKTTFEGNYSIDVDPKERLAKVFGTRLSGETRESSSRLTRGQPRTIMGIKVPDKPPEPDNCCMSGCINCVWELYKDDIKDWNDVRKEAAEKVNQSKTDFIWPVDFDPPIKFLDQKHIPPELRVTQDIKKIKETESSDPWSNVPVAIQVFADTEKRIKAKKLEKERKLKQSQMASSEAP